MIAVVDAGTGNLRSVVRALEAAADTASPPRVVITRDPDVVRRAGRVVMPGQGAFGDCARALAADGGALGRAVVEAIGAGRPFLGICLGMQVLFATSDEAPGLAGLGVFPGHVRRFTDGMTDDDGDVLKIPHIGWNRAESETDAARAALGPSRWYYFVHSFYVVPDDPRIVAARTRHGETFTSAVMRDNVLAVQFHPEKSQRAGLSLLGAWLKDAT
ncbi:MAG: imidazole glycerol phosphate synthase subunit HisH [Deltaproteobacteria bacterium]